LIVLKNQQQVKCFKLVFVQNNAIYDDDDVFEQHIVKGKLSKTTLDADEDESILEPTFQEFYFDINEENLYVMHQHAVNQLSQMSKKHVQNTLSKPIARDWE
jgi:hypothetical protein